MTREELLSSPEYWTAELQTELYRQIESYMSRHGLNKAQFAGHLGCSKSYITLPHKSNHNSPLSILNSQFSLTSPMAHCALKKILHF
jgi:hypothetical protein